MTSVLNPICRGLVGYVSYLATCKTSPVYSEYLLYEPMLRIAIAQKFSVRCEVDVGEIKHGKGDKKRIDFVLSRLGEHVAIEVKWCKSKRPNIQNDCQKLSYFCKDRNKSGYVVLFGSAKVIESVTPYSSFPEQARGKIVSWLSGKTHYGAVWIRYF